MRNVGSLGSAVRRYPTFAGVAIALAATMGLTVAARGQTGQASAPGWALLAEDVTKLGIVVMANQTAITQADAKAVLPILEKLQAQRGGPGPESAGLDEKAAADLDAQLRAARSPKLRAAVEAVRLLVPAAPPEQAGRQPRPDGRGGGGPDGRDGRGGGPGGPGRGRPGWWHGWPWWPARPRERRPGWHAGTGHGTRWRRRARSWPRHGTDASRALGAACGLLQRRDWVALELVADPLTQTGSRQCLDPVLIDFVLSPTPFRSCLRPGIDVPAVREVLRHLLAPCSRGVEIHFRHCQSLSVLDFGQNSAPGRDDGGLTDG